MTSRNFNTIIPFVNNNGLIESQKINLLRPWSRFQGQCIYDENIAIKEFDMRRKAEILKYKQNSNQPTKSIQYARLARGPNKWRKSTWATQNYIFTDPNVQKLNEVRQVQRIDNTQFGDILDDAVIQLNCRKNVKIPSQPTSASNVPRSQTVSSLELNPNIPLINYVPVRKTYLAGSEKWPQKSWEIGDRGFPRGKQGNATNNFIPQQNIVVLETFDCN